MSDVIAPEAATTEVDTPDELTAFKRQFGEFGEKEIRSFDFASRPEVRDSGAGADQFTVRGYASVFGRESLDLGGFTEFIAPNAFTNVLQRDPDVFATWDHDTRYVLARTRNRTLDLNQDERGLAFWFRAAPVSYANDLRALLEGGYIDQASFMFTVAADEWEIHTDSEGNEKVIRTILEVGDLYDICVTAMGAYPQTNSELVRSYINSYAQSRIALPEAEERVIDAVEERKPNLALAKSQARARRKKLGL